MKKFIAIILALTFCLGFASCGEKGYKDDLTALAVGEKIKEVAKNEGGYKQPEADFVSFNLKGVSDYCSDYAIFMSNKDTDMNEFGVFHASSAKNTKEVEKICKAYLEKKNENYTPDYLPEEYPKIKDAKVFVYGNYVVYLVLNEADRANVNTAVTALLSEGK